MFVDDRLIAWGYRNRRLRLPPNDDDAEEFFFPQCSTFLECPNHRYNQINIYLVVVNYIKWVDIRRCTSPIEHITCIDGFCLIPMYIFLSEQTARGIEERALDGWRFVHVQRDRPPLSFCSALPNSFVTYSDHLFDSISSLVFLFFSFFFFFVRCIGFPFSLSEETRRCSFASPFSKQEKKKKKKIFVTAVSGKKRKSFRLLFLDSTTVCCSFFFYILRTPSAHLLVSPATRGTVGPIYPCPLCNNHLVSVQNHQTLYVYILLGWDFITSHRQQQQQFRYNINVGVGHVSPLFVDPVVVCAYPNEINK